MRAISIVFSKVHPVVLIAPVLAVWLSASFLAGAAANISGGMAAGGAFGTGVGNDPCAAGTYRGYAAGNLSNIGTSSTPNGILRSNRNIPGGISSTIGKIRNTDDRCIGNYWRAVTENKLSRVLLPITPADPIRATNELDLAQFDASTLPNGTLIPEIASLPGSEEDINGFSIKANGDLEVRDSTNLPTRAVRATIYVSGDLIIKENLTNNRGNFISRSDLGNLTFVVDGDIYISQNVTEIDAVLVSLATTSVPNRVIHTCADTADPTAPLAKTDCAGALNINGALIGENIVMKPASRNVTVNLGYEYYVAVPAQQPLTSGVYSSNSLQSLPPVF